MGSFVVKKNASEEENLAVWYRGAYENLIRSAGAHTSPDAIIGSREEELTYLKLHRGRYLKIISLAHRYAPCPSPHILDIGTSHLTLLLQERFGNVATIDVGGGWEKRMRPSGVPFSRCDLAKDDLGLGGRRFDLVVCAEIIEHIPRSPAMLLARIFRLLGPHGILILTTPNATSYYRRRDMLFGKNPFQVPPRGNEPPGSWHAREYTMAELCGFTRAAGFRVVKSLYPSYWNHPRRAGIFSRLKGFIVSGALSLWPSLRDALVLIAERPTLSPEVDN